MRRDDCSVERFRWSDLPSVGAGTRAFVAGPVAIRGGRVVFGPSGKDSPLVILHDGDDKSLIRRAVGYGRHGNEYWNPVTQVSIALGVATMSGILSLSRLGGMPSLVAALTLCAAFSPILPLMPPGVVGFFAYRWLWKRALRFRSMRDLEFPDNGWSRKACALRGLAYESDGRQCRRLRGFVCRQRMADGLSAQTFPVGPPSIVICDIVVARNNVVIVVARNIVAVGFVGIVAKTSRPAEIVAESVIRSIVVPVIKEPRVVDILVGAGRGHTFLLRGQTVAVPATRCGFLHPPARSRPFSLRG
ncbi:MAG: hypothetical protein MZV63_46695 [Marinilabiliales bacterium]|nr:hypothetical protein [Marinilabiliales bacterium]